MTMRKETTQRFTLQGYIRSERPKKFDQSVYESGRVFLPSIFQNLEISLEFLRFCEFFQYPYLKGGMPMEAKSARKRGMAPVGMNLIQYQHAEIQDEASENDCWTKRRRNRNRQRKTRRKIL